MAGEAATVPADRLPDRFSEIAAACGSEPVTLCLGVAAETGSGAEAGSGCDWCRAFASLLRPNPPLALESAPARLVDRHRPPRARRVPPGPPASPFRSRTPPA